MEANIRSMPKATESATRQLAEPSLSVDTLEQILIEEEHQIAKHRAVQIAALQLIDRAQVATADGARNLSEWVAGRLDVGLDTSRDLVRTMRRIEHRPELRAALADGSASFDRVEAASRIIESGPDPLSLHLDVNGVRREAAHRARTSRDAEQRTFLDRYLVMQPTLDQSWWKLWGGLDGVTGAIVDTALNEAADQLPVDPDSGQAHDGAWRKATALAQLCVSDDPPPAQISVFIEAACAAPTDGEAGVYLEAGPGIGRLALEGLLCESITEVTVSSEGGEPMRYGRRSRAIPPALRRAILRRDGNRCVVDGCDSRSRLQVHHVVPWSRGGATDPSNLIAVCWYHHHIAIHQLELEPYRHPEHGRIRLRRIGRAPPD
ncbi:MAG TPA: HNH endonuclease [Acidimicrobiia bacterium]|nr:HNH endonuclease [Acidimicrobiia bacterium]